MEIGIIGTGKIGSVLARQLTKLGREVPSTKRCVIPNY
jgi:predicted dinucleotide-binding enzyme